MVYSQDTKIATKTWFMTNTATVVIKELLMHTSQLILKDRKYVSSFKTVLTEHDQIHKL